VTLLTQAVTRAPGTPSAPFADVVMAASSAEFGHLQALKKLGGRSLTRIPDAVLDGGAGLFDAVAMQEEVEISTYLQGVTLTTSRRRTREAWLFAETLGTEADHRVLARFAKSVILGTAATEVPAEPAHPPLPGSQLRGRLIVEPRPAHDRRARRHAGFFFPNRRAHACSAAFRRLAPLVRFARLSQAAS
jgi:hypothetical protein